MPYDHIVGVFAGDWYDASKIYRDWALQQDWVRKGTLYSRTDIPDWFKNIAVVQKAKTHTGSYPVDSIYDYAVDLAGRMAGTLAVVWYGWGASGTDDYPPLLEAQPGVNDVISDLWDHDIPVFPYVNSLIWDSTLPSWPAAQDYAVKNPDGSICYWSAPYAQMDHGTSWWRDYLSNMCRDIVQLHGVKGIYLDQAGQLKSTAADYDPGKGNPIGLTRSTLAFNHQALEEIATAVHSVDPEVMLWGEGSAEYSMDVLHGKIIHYNLWEGIMPLTSAVYHDYWTFYGRKQRIIDPPDPNIENEMTAGWLFTIGAQIARIYPEDYNSPDVQRILGYVTKLSQLRSDASKYIIFGQMMRPPFIDRNTIPELVAVLVKGGTVKLPAVLAAVWKSPQGQLGLAVTNMDDQQLTFDVEMDLDKYGMEASPVYQLVELGEPNALYASTSRILQFALTLNALDAKVYEINTSNCAQYKQSDLNRDCYVNFQDFAVVVKNWLACTDPNDIDCENVL